jgi:hypothetical protein
MVEQGKRSFEEVSDTECLLASKDADGSVRSVGPFSRERAEALLQVYGRMYPNQTCWIEPLPNELKNLHLGRVSRLRAARGRATIRPRALTKS